MRQRGQGAYDVEPIYRNAFLPTHRGRFITGDFRRPLFESGQAQLHRCDSSILSYASSKRPYKLYEDFYFVLLKKFRHEIQGRLGNRFTKPVFSLDSTTISLCLRLFEWAQHRRCKGGIKLHTLLNNDTSLPELIVETPAKTSDIKEDK